MKFQKVTYFWILEDIIDGHTFERHDIKIVFIASPFQKLQ